MNAQRLANPLQGHTAANMHPMESGDICGELQQMIDRSYRQCEGIGQRGFRYLHFGEGCKEEANSRHLAILREKGGGISVNPHLGVNQEVIIRSLFLNRRGADHAVSHREVDDHVPARLPDRMHDAFDLDPLRVCRPSQHPRKARARSLSRDMRLSDDAYPGPIDYGGEVSGSADPDHVNDRSRPERKYRASGDRYKNVAGRVVNE